MYSCEIWANADPFCAGADPCIRNFVGHPRHVLGTILLCYQYINLLWPMYSCEIWADADPFCAGADPCIRNLSDIHTMYQKFVRHPCYVLGTILVFYQYMNLPWWTCCWNTHFLVPNWHITCSTCWWYESHQLNHILQPSHLNFEVKI